MFPCVCFPEAGLFTCHPSPSLPLEAHSLLLLLLLLLSPFPLFTLLLCKASSERLERERYTQRGRGRGRKKERARERERGGEGEKECSGKYLGCFSFLSSTLDQTHSPTQLTHAADPFVTFTPPPSLSLTAFLSLLPPPCPLLSQAPLPVTRHSSCYCLSLPLSISLSPPYLSISLSLPHIYLSLSPRLCPDHSWILQFYCKPQHYSPFLSRCLSFFPFLSVETAVPHWLSLTGHNSAGKKKKACPCTVT